MLIHTAKLLGGLDLFLRVGPVVLETVATVPLDRPGKGSSHHGQITLALAGDMGLLWESQGPTTLNKQHSD